MYIVSKAVRYSRYVRTVVPFHLDDLNCTGDEESLLGCQHNGVGVHDCGPYDNAAVICYTGI